MEEVEVDIKSVVGNLQSPIEIDDLMKFTMEYDNIKQCYEFIRTFRGGIENLPISALLGKVHKAVNTKQQLVDRNPVDNHHQLKALEKLKKTVVNISIIFKTRDQLVADVDLI